MVIAPGDRADAHAGLAGGVDVAHFVAHQQEAFGGHFMAPHQAVDLGGLAEQVGAAFIVVKQRGGVGAQHALHVFNGVRTDHRQSHPARLQLREHLGDTLEKVHAGVDVLHQRAHVRHDGRQLPQRNSQVLQDFRGFAMTQVFAFGQVDLAEAVFVGHRVQNGIEPRHGVRQGSVEVECSDVVFQVINPFAGLRRRYKPLG
ncbi:hypothetical protein D3C87_1503350 [compost metagenome]